MTRSPRELVEAYGLLADGSVLWNRESGPDIPDDELLALRSLDIQSAELVRGRTEVKLVTTSPDWLTGSARTRFVLQQLFDEAREEILILGYELSDPSIIRQLGYRTAVGVRATVIVDKGHGTTSLIQAHWPKGAGLIDIWESGTLSDNPTPSLHAKAVIADGKSALVSSANLTWNGLNANIELGVLVRGAIAEEIRGFARSLISNGLVTRRKTLSAPT